MSGVEHALGQLLSVKNASFDGTSGFPRRTPSGRGLFVDGHPQLDGRRQHVVDVLEVDLLQVADGLVEDVILERSRLKSFRVFQFFLSSGRDSNP